MEHIKTFNDYESIISYIPKKTDLLLLGESTHGTEEFYKIRSDITKTLIENFDFNIILFETDWFNLYSVNKFINNKTDTDDACDALINMKSFPAWLWKNNIIIELITWLKRFNSHTQKKIYLLGLDCYLLIESFNWLTVFLKMIDISLYNKINKELSFIKKFKKTQDLVIAIMNNSLHISDVFFENYLQDLLIIIQNNSVQYQNICKEKNIDIIAVISSEICCDVMINSFEYFKKQLLEPPGSNASWNTRDQHMLMTTMKLKDKIKDSKIIIWAHNSHIGDSTSTEQGGTDFSNNNSWNLGQMCRAMFSNTFNIGFGTYFGTVKAAPEWNSKEEIYALNLPLEDSIESYIYKECSIKNIKNAIIDLSKCNIFPFNSYVKQRMIGVVYCPSSELHSHYISCIINKQYNLYIFITLTSALEKISPKKKFTESF